ncbi:tRNA (adenine(22)-N(1))-methyltransferase [Velocimicrobium porci]|uniref:SAM-dependent methyltransferase n=1 Tax=Velocimicrobium porci TaxID=2606634 RepID=A0A6L5XUH2_9FIRM|nr:class I SAM-dependent methyltransferase [Velocimicrobium porci]MSS62460.1 SAM-dependent methyltransferase [Velocimicrobium porci]
MQLSKRLTMVADFVTEGNRIADIGCDHAHTSIYLIEQKKATASIAMDINEGPLERAKDNIKRYGYEQKIKTRLSDGARELKKGEADTILISGMGGGLIVKILTDSEEVVKDASELILQPQSEIDNVRRCVHKLGFSIIAEDMLTEDGKHYTAIKARKGREQYKKEVFYRYGKILLEAKNPVLKEFLLYGKNSFSNVIGELDKQSYDRNKKRLEELKLDLAYMEEALEYYKE